MEYESRMLIEKALALHATDIHLNPKEKNAAVVFRIHGKLQQVFTVNRQYSERLIAHFKFRAGMDIGEQRRPQNGAFMLKNTSPPVNLRFSTMPSNVRESLSIRVLPQNEFHMIPSLTFDPKVISYFYSLISYTNGMIILTGPTGSGKTTSLYTLMNELQIHYDSRIVSMEDPVEIQNDAFIQTEVNEKAGLSYMELLKSSLRHDPDVLMIGEIRDHNTARLAIRAALSGHLVLTTMHASSPSGAINRMLDFGCSVTDLQETLLCLTSQELFPRYCYFCNNDSCSLYCNKNKYTSRLALFDILAGSQLQQVLSSNNTKSSTTLTFSKNHQMIRGWVLGLFSNFKVKESVF
ncbi:competence type IV pilus ATPase ComGA [Salibacterium salarium]|uniref:competence type IV pilus ATPase ComGA n=1 Tax=Salibacterium salarium TaxID=284579 RepID=UPI0027D7A918|nr:competence type IV pilus ATPase ComGA [Salibacterium salarium]